MSQIAALYVTLGANSAKLHADLAASQKRIKNWGQRARKQFNTVAKATAVAAAAMGAALIGMTETSAAEIDRLAKQADKIGIQVQALQRLEYQAELTGVSQKKLGMSLQRMVRRVSEAAQGTGEAQGAIKELGLDAQKLAQLAPEQQFAALSEAMKGVANQGDRVRLAMKLFDSEGVDLVNTMAADLDGLGKEFDDLGVAITRQQAAMVESYNDSKTKLGTLWDGFANQFTVKAAPHFQAIVEYLQDLTKEFGGMGNIATNVMGFVSKGVAYAADAIWGMRLVIKLVQKAFANFAAGVLDGLEWIQKQAAKTADFLGLDFDKTDFFSGMAKSFRDQAAKVDADYEKLINKGRPSVEIEAKVKQINAEIDKLAASKTTEPAVKAADSFNAAADSADKAAKNLDKVGKSKAWEKVFGESSKRDIPQYFKDDARDLRLAQLRGDDTAVQKYLDRMQKTIESAVGKSKGGFYKADLYDVFGMDEVYKQLKEGVATKNLGEVTLNLKSENGTSRGTVQGDGDFMKELAESLGKAASGLG